MEVYFQIGETMKLHATVIEHLINLMEQYGGFRNQVKLRNELSKVDLSEYTQVTKNDNKVLVLTTQLKEEERKARGG